MNEQSILGANGDQGWGGGGASGYQGKRKSGRRGLECDNKVSKICRQRGRSLILVGLNNCEHIHMLTSRARTAASDIPLLFSKDADSGITMIPSSGR